MQIETTIVIKGGDAVDLHTFLQKLRAGGKGFVRPHVRVQVRTDGVALSFEDDPDFEVKRAKPE